MRAGGRANLSRAFCSAVPLCLTLHRPGLDHSGCGAAQHILGMGSKGGLGRSTRLIKKGGFCEEQERCGLCAGVQPPALALPWASPGAAGRPEGLGK